MEKTQMDVWDKRAATIFAQIDSLMADTASRRDIARALTPRGKTVVENLEQLLGCLRDFGENQFNYFKGEFLNENSYKDELTEYPQENVLRSTLDQMGYDLSVISQAINQRFSADESVIATLELADGLSRHALEPAAAFGLANTRVISYLQKSPSIRVFPYADTALIGIPQTAVALPRDFLAIPHEVGHFVYWHGIMKNDKEDKMLSYYLEDIAKELMTVKTGKMKGEKEDAYYWLEEMFADIYGCFIAGPALAFSFQELHLQQTQSNFFKDDQDHPPPILRPNIYTKTIAKKLNREGLTAWAIQLSKRWNGDLAMGNGKINRRKKRVPKKPGEVDFENEYLPKKGGSKKVDAVISTDPTKELDTSLEVEKLMEEIFNIVNSSSMNLSSENLWDLILNQAANQDPIEVGLHWLLNNFEEKINDSALDMSGVESGAGESIACVSYEDLLERWNARPKEATDPEWLRVFVAGGWTTEGPDCNESSGSC